ncbi:MAG: hypothetical protein K2M12_00590, partial [Muribaculaceae bacterium]|nr:hypothetical protein [Muribaculaceae bacterium]
RKYKVEYTYCGSANADAEGIPGTGDKLFYINHTEHNTVESAGSIMGRGGCAMVIPTVNIKWEGLADPNIGASKYTTDKMYFSVLLRATNSDNGAQVYPYPGDTSGMTVVYYAVDQSGTIISRVYPGSAKDEFYTDRELHQRYIPAEGITVMDFGWASVPVDANWSAGKRYVYTLNYSDGIGWHDPEDPEPGKPITGTTEPISWGVSVGSWEYAVKNSDYDPDINVP